MVAGPFAWLRRNSQEQAREHSVGTTTHGGTSSSTHTEQGASVADAAVNLGGDTSYQPPDRSDAGGGEAAPTAAAAPRRLLADQHGWQLSADCTAPVLGVIGGRQIRFGGLVGVGSSGSSQVYRATWGPSSIEVAVKVTPFDSSSSSSSSSSRAGSVPVEQQLQELELLDHPNIVRTYCGVTFTAQQQQQQQQRAQTLSASAAAGHGCSTSGMPEPHLPKEQPDAANRSSSSSARDQQPRQQQPGGSSSSSGAVKAGLLQQQLQQCPGQAVPVKWTEAEMWLVQEFCDLGSLRDVSLEWQLTGEGDLQMFERLSLLVEAAVGLKHLHDRGLVHGDLTARNVMVSSSTQSRVRMAAKLTDVAGVCPCLKQQQRLGTTPTTVTTNSTTSKPDSKPDSLSVGTIGSNTHTTVGVRELSHVAPERLRNPEGPAGPAQDVYSFGILMWEVFTGQQAYRKLRDAQHLYEAIVIQHLRPKIPDGMPADYQLLLERCWASDPADRPSADKLIGCLSVMAAERHRRINPHAAAALLELPGSPASVLRGQQQQQQQQQQRQRLSLGGGASVWRQGSGSGSGGGGGGTGMSRQCFSAGRLPVVGMSPRGAAGCAGTPPVGSLLLQHKSCPASAFEAFLQQSGSSLYGCSPKSAAGDRSDSFDAAAAADPDAADAAVFAELQEEHEMLLQLRASSHTQSGPGSVPTLHSSQPHQRYADGHLDMQLSGLDDAHTWHI